ncbi:MAG: nitrous oxide reductase accessory protein NosL [Gammaproteobacteria bacterium]|nr:nitrous oxide reductase accessory protein NosL [Gammaproteobacteria bacterium]
MRKLLAGCILTLALSGCGPAEQQSTGPLEITRSTACALDGMLLGDYPGPAAQIHYERGSPEFFCDTMELFSIYLRPEQVRTVTALYVQDMGKTGWENPQGNWIDAKLAYYVHGSTKHGAMGPTLAPFSRQEDAENFVRQFGGTVLRFDRVTPDLVALDGGALHDQRM